MKASSYPTMNLPEYSGYKFIANGGNIYRNVAAKPGALLMIIIPTLETCRRSMKH